VSATQYFTHGEYTKKIGARGEFPSGELQQRYERIVRRLREEPQRYFEAAEPPVFLPVLSLRRPVSELVKCQAVSPRGNVGIYIKFFLARRPTPEAQERAVQRMYREEAVTRELYARLDTHSVYTVPRIVAFFPEEQAIVMEESTGQRLLDILLQKGRGYPGRSTLQELARYCRAVGGWLKHVQQLTQTTTGPQLRRADFLEYVTLRLAKLPATQRLLSDDAADRILRSLERLLRQVPETLGMACGVHGDLSLSNILVTSNKVTVLDFSMYHIGSSYHDPSYFYSRIESIYHLLISKSTTSYLQKAFTEEYGYDMESNRQFFQLYYIRHKVNRLLALSDFQHLSIIRKIYQKHQFARCWNDLKNAL
jgi:tRNA A-37 threonylcarbamoyl transferase component Bud32